MSTQLELEALHRQESSEHNAQILETKVTRGKADIFNGKIPAGQLPIPTSEPFKIATLEDTTDPLVISDLSNFELVYIEFFEDFSYWVPFTLFDLSVNKIFVLPYYSISDETAGAMEVNFTKSTKTFTFTGIGITLPSEVKVYYK